MSQANADLEKSLVGSHFPTVKLNSEKTQLSAEKHQLLQQDIHSIADEANLVVANNQLTVEKAQLVAVNNQLTVEWTQLVLANDQLTTKEAQLTAELIAVKKKTNNKLKH